MGTIKMQIRLPKNGQTEGPVNFVEEQSFNCMHVWECACEFFFMIYTLKTIAFKSTLGSAVFYRL